MTSVAGLSRLPCATCKCDTLHKGAACVHCKRVCGPDRQRREHMERIEQQKIENFHRKNGPGKPKKGRV